MSRSLRSDRLSGSVGRTGRSLCSDRPNGLVGHVSFAGRSLCSDRPNGLVGHYVATDRMAWSVTTSVVCGLLVLLRVECDKIGVATCEGCLRTLVEGIKPFIVRPGVEILKTCFPMRPLRSSLYVVKRLSGMLLPMAFYIGVEGRLRVVIS
ncbi:hypothetical protein DY000_02014829 [Brassica cretica]|uniref:Uncharacterized protein n=1 Tax=Brassica cretica TaxID=69181 RepID=A0ABQ7CQ07_BRACR|nr:hypothetical protein DY000_02014829 [Brassica cretica]